MLTIQEKKTQKKKQLESFNVINFVMKSKLARLIDFVSQVY